MYEWSEPFGAAVVNTKIYLTEFKIESAVSAAILQTRISPLYLLFPVKVLCGKSARHFLNELAEYVLKNNIFKHNTSFYKKLRRTAIGIKIAPPYAIIFITDLEGKLLIDYGKNLSHGGGNTFLYRYFYVLAAWWKITWKIFIISELLLSHNKIYRQIFTGGDKISRYFSQEDK